MTWGSNFVFPDHLAICECGFLKKNDHGPIGLPLFLTPWGEDWELDVLSLNQAASFWANHSTALNGGSFSCRNIHT